MRPPLHQRFVDKSAAAITAAVEVYNKPSFLYREETFAILALNAWELLLKAKVLKDADNAIASLRVYETPMTKAGKPSKVKHLKRNRAGNAHSISLKTCLAKLEANTASRLPKEVKANLDALTEIRDNSVHFITASPTLARQAQELAAASVSNLVVLAKKWFNKDFSSVLNLVLPLSFVAPPQGLTTSVVSADETRLIDHLRAIAEEVGIFDSDYAVAVRLDLKLEKSNLSNASRVQVTRDVDAVPIQLTEANIREKYPWDYQELTRRLNMRYTDFRINQAFHDVRTPLHDDDRYAKVRYLDPANHSGLSKRFFNPNILTVFDQHYTKRTG